MGKKAKNKKKANRAKSSVKVGGEAVSNNKSVAPKLQFIEHIQWQGFNNAELTRLIGNSTRAIRELVQNSLDAAVERDDDGIAEIHFVMEETSHAHIPGMKEYKTALNNAIKSNEGQSDQSDSVANTLLTSAEREKSTTLFVFDNGIGLNEKRMCAIYNNGISEKEGGWATGSYGNGHFTTFVLSGLRYVLYGGINQGDSIFGGHAIIASHKDKGIRYGKDGFYVSGFKRHCEDDEEPYVFPDESEMPDFIRDQIDFIRQKWKNGSVIAVPAFNYFWGKSSDKAVDAIVKSVMMNFFVAIKDEKLRVTVRDHGKEKTISSKDVESVLINCQKKRGGQGFPSGPVVWNSYQTLLQGSRYIVDTPKGKVELRIRKGGNKSVAICRNGMWITNKIAGLRQHEFGDKEPFDALLLVDKNGGEEVYKLFKKAEGPDHIDILNLDDRMGPKEQKLEFDKCLDAIAVKIKEIVGDRKGDEFAVRDFIVFEGSEATSSSRSVNSSSRTTKTGEATSVSNSERIRAGEKGKRTPKSALKSGTGLNVKISSRRRSQGITDIRFRPDIECENVEFRMQVDRGRDDTCTGRLKRESWETISLKSVKIDGKAIPSNRFIPDREDGNKKIGVFIGAVVAGKSHEMTIEYDAPPSFLGDHAMKWFFLRRKKSSPVVDEEQ